MKNNFFFRIIVAGTMVFLLTFCSTELSAQRDTTIQNPPPNQHPRPPRGERPQFADLLTKMDADKDGKLSKTEIKGPLKKDFSKIDKDKNGFISETEFKNAPPPKRRKRRKEDLEEN